MEKSFVTIKYNEFIFNILRKASAWIIELSTLIMFIYTVWNAY